MFDVEKNHSTEERMFRFKHDSIKIYANLLLKNVLKKFDIWHRKLLIFKYDILHFIVIHWQTNPQFLIP